LDVARLDMKFNILMKLSDYRTSCLVLQHPIIFCSKYPQLQHQNGKNVRRFSKFNLEKILNLHNFSSARNRVKFFGLLLDLTA